MRLATIEHDRTDRCREVLDDLPEWFGIPASKAAYIAASSHMPMLGWCDEREFAGFLSLKRHTKFAAEVYVVGVKRKFHRQGIGRALIDAAAQSCGREGVRFLTVKTLPPSDPDPHYEATRNFYRAVGFLPVEVFPTFWGPSNPCLLMVRLLDVATAAS
ncbi:MAG TPA: GNAT family N-acetyltransferase [Roseiarcus sp.]